MYTNFKTEPESRDNFNACGTRAEANSLKDREIYIFNARAHTLTMEETTSFIVNNISNGGFIQHSVINVSKVVSMQRDENLQRSVNSCDLINIDGAGIVLAARLLGHPIPERVAGIDLFCKLMAEASEKGISVYLLGAKQEIVEKVRDRAKTDFPSINIAGFHHGYFWEQEEDIVNEISASGAQMLFVAITSPMKENFINKWKDRLGVQFAMGVGGSFDVYAGLTRRAPIWMQQSGLEWLFRVYQEPRRMWKRYLISNLRFFKMLTMAMAERAYQHLHKKRSIQSKN